MSGDTLMGDTAGVGARNEPEGNLGCAVKFSTGDPSAGSRESH